MHWHSPNFFEQFVSLGVLSLVIIGIASSARRNRLQKEREHFERMRAMELGLAPMPNGMDWPAAAVCIAMGAGVPIGSFLVTWLASLTGEVPDGIWVAPVVVSFPAIGAARKLAYRVLDPRSGSKQVAFTKPAPSGKPEFDPDAFDVVGRRG